MTDAAYIIVPAVQGTRRLEVKRANFGATGTATTTLVGAVAGKHIRLLSLSFRTGGATTFDIGDGESFLYGTDDEEANMRNVAHRDAHRMDFNEEGWFQTGLGLPLELRSASGSADVAGCLNYCEV